MCCRLGTVAQARHDVDVSSPAEQTNAPHPFEGKDIRKLSDGDAFLESVAAVPAYGNELAEDVAKLFAEIDSKAAQLEGGNS